MKNIPPFLLRILVTLGLMSILIGAGYLLIYQMGFAQYELPDDQQALIDTYGTTAETPALEDSYDVIVVGGEPEGVAAAVAAGRNGAKTLLVEHRDGLGGLFTYGWLNYLDMTLNHDEENVARGLFNEWHSLVGGEEVFHIDVAKAAFMKMIADEENVTLALNTTVEKPLVADDLVNGVTLTHDGETKDVMAHRVIDATQDADLAVAAGVSYTYGAEDINQDGAMAVTPVIRLSGVDWFKVREAAKQELFGTATVSDITAHGFSELHTMYTPSQDGMRLRGLNLARVGKDEVYINALHLFGVNGTVEAEVEAAMERGQRETVSVLAYLRQHFPGFEEAEIEAFPPEFYVRETRHIDALYELQMSDIWANRDFQDTIAIGGYPVDVQATSANNTGYVISNPDQFGIPFRSIVPQDKLNMLVVGRSAGFSSIASGSARIVPTGMAIGQAAGTAAAQSIAEALDFHAFAESEEQIEQLRQTLVAQDQYIPRFEADYPYKGHPADEAIQTLMNYGVLVGGYNNDLNLDSALNHHSFVNLIRELVKRSNAELFQANEQHMVDLNDFIYNEEPKNLTPEKSAEVIYAAFGETGEPTWEGLTAFLSADTIAQFATNETLTRAEAYIILADLLETVNEES
ncbi:FAD-dependent oxidoreductase [Bacillaceae bacterium SIJ1]|uniref:FAD-dependent oxidoreductase n=1 Tax=Litoribacterium kuwaitense TaxID=1398745 RepID=UPI0013EA49E0|nr:FAD-dependent oxidoreductase [Litoribacterium kuwaitense]NGP46508.1 FAD-dependent oxidoreductase [Litoribacterium kuwaitense]